MIHNLKAVFLKIDRNIAKIEVFLLCITLTFLFSVGFYQVVCREIANSGAIWPEHLLRYSVLVLGFLGASLATRENRNIKIDIITHLMESRGGGRWWQICEGILFLVGATISVVLISATWQYIAVEKMLSMPIPNTEIPVYWVFFVPLIFFILSGIRYLFYGIFKLAGEEMETDAMSTIKEIN